MSFLKPINLQPYRSLISPPPSPIGVPEPHPSNVSPTSVFLNRRQGFSGEPLTPNLDVQHRELYDSPPTRPSQSLPQSHMRIALPPPAFGFLTPQPPRWRFSVHPIALLPAFVLGLLVSYAINPFQSSSPSHFFEAPFIHPPRIADAFGPTRARVERDHAYFPSDLQSHPIHELIANASRAWHAKLESQSKTLEQAVNEYIRRYGRKPPRGFKEWFEWCVNKRVLLVDEYDRVNEIVEPFWALSPHVLRNRSEHAGLGDTHSVFRIHNGNVSVEGSRKDDGRTKDQLRLIEGFVKFLPDVNITMSHHDGPSVFLDWATKTKHVQNSRAGTIIPDEEVDKVEDDASLAGFVGACSPESPMRMHANGLLFQEHQGVGFIGIEHAKTMDLCLHPEWQFLHGFTSWPGPRPGPLTPIFSFAQSSAFAADLLDAPLEQFEDVDKNAGQFKPWRMKTESSRLMWRGKTTGVWFDRLSNWRTSHRMRLHALGNPSPVLAESRRPVHFAKPTGGLIVERRRVGELVERYLSANFVGELVQCSVEDGTCVAAAKDIKFGPAVDWEFQNNHKYVLDVDGNSWSGRFRRLLASNSLVFKSSIWPEWYRDHIQAWYHYVPVRIDYNDVFDLMAFFTGDLEGKGGFEDRAEQIGNQGREWVEHHFRLEDIQSYMWRTYLEYARVSSDNRLDMNFELE